MSARPSSYLPKYPNAAPAAYAVLDEARKSGDCDPQLDLLLLVAADNQPRDRGVHTEALRAEMQARGYHGEGDR